MPELQHTVVVHITDNNDVFIFDISASVSFQLVEYMEPVVVLTFAFHLHLLVIVISIMFCFLPKLNKC